MRWLTLRCIQMDSSRLFRLRPECVEQDGDGGQRLVPPKYALRSDRSGLQWRLGAGPCQPADQHFLGAHRSR